MALSSTPGGALDRRSVREADRIAIDEYRVPGVVLMENAARALAAHALDMLAALSRPAPVVLIACGAGNNGGDGYALARHLHNARIEPVLACLGIPREGSDAATNREIARRIGLRELDAGDLQRMPAADLIVDALLGTGLDRPVEGPAAELISWMNRSGAATLAVDVPSGLDCDTGRPLGVAVKALRTVTFLATKVGFLQPQAAEYTGQIVVADIGAPREIVERLLRERRTTLT